jgi:Flp pilus assembly protein TadG
MPRRLGTLARLWRDRRGVVLIYGTFVLAAIFGMGGLAIDGGRLMSLHSDMQSYADHAALAAAGELDGNDGAIAQATVAANNYVADAQKFASGGPGGLDIAGLRFLHSLPASDDDPITAAFVTTDDAEAAYVEVTVGPLQTDNILMAGLVLIGIVPDMQGEATVTAVAGGPNAERGRFFCDITPLMFCVPGGMSREELRTWLPGRQIRLKAAQGPGWGPGAFGLLNVNFDPNGPCGAPNTGADFFRCAVAVEQSITRCFSRQGVDVMPGQASGPSESGFNVRMDIYATSLGSRRNHPLFRPAPNVIKGVRPRGGGSCITSAEPLESNVAPLPIEQCLLDGTCPGPSARFSPAQTVDPAQRAAYVEQNYTNVGAPDRTGGATTRYGMYMNELASAGNGPILDSPPLEETGRRTCASSASPDPERRVLIAAGIEQ